MFELLYAAGLRVSELTRLTIKEVDIEGGTLKCYGKGRKERMVPVGKVALGYVSLYLAQRRGLVAGAGRLADRRLVVNVRRRAKVRPFKRRAATCCFPTDEVELWTVRRFACC